MPMPTIPMASTTSGPLVIQAMHMIDFYMDARRQVVRQHFGYIFETPPGSYYPPLLNGAASAAGRALHVTAARRSDRGHAFPPRSWRDPFPRLSLRRYRLFARSQRHPGESRGFLEDLDLWIVDALRYMPHPSHFSLAETLDRIERLKPKRAVLTNLHTDLDFERLRSELPANVEPAFDGMRVSA